MSYGIGLGIQPLVTTIRYEIVHVSVMHFNMPGAYMCPLGQRKPKTTAMKLTKWGMLALCTQGLRPCNPPLKKKTRKNKKKKKHQKSRKELRSLSFHVGEHKNLEKY